MNRRFEISAMDRMHPKVVAIIQKLNQYGEYHIFTPSQCRGVHVSVENGMGFHETVDNIDSYLANNPSTPQPAMMLG